MNQKLPHACPSLHFVLFEKLSEAIRFYCSDAFYEANFLLHAQFAFFFQSKTHNYQLWIVYSAFIYNEINLINILLLKFLKNFLQINNFSKLIIFTHLTSWLLQWITTWELWVRMTLRAELVIGTGMERLTPKNNKNYRI